jgi:hypothetical protein
VEQAFGQTDSRETHAPPRTYFFRPDFFAARPVPLAFLTDFFAAFFLVDGFFFADFLAAFFFVAFFLRDDLLKIAPQFSLKSLVEPVLRTVTVVLLSFYKLLSPLPMAFRTR